MRLARWAGRLEAVAGGGTGSQGHSLAKVVALFLELEAVAGGGTESRLGRSGTGDDTRGAFEMSLIRDGRSLPWAIQ